MNFAGSSDVHWEWCAVMSYIYSVTILLKFFVTFSEVLGNFSVYCSGTTDLLQCTCM